MTARQIIFVRHSETQPVPGTSSHAWQLTPDGVRRCDLLAEWLRPYRLTAVASSPENKALQTAQPVASALDIPLISVDELREHDRSNETAWLDTEQFHATIRRLFAEPATLVYGRETADEAFRRFSDAVTHILTGHPGGNLALVTHATVLSLFVARHTGQDPFTFWHTLTMPACVVFDLPGFVLREVALAF